MLNIYPTCHANFYRLEHVMKRHTVGCATKNECYNEQFLSIKSGCYNEHRCYIESGGILSADVARACALRVGPSRFD